MSLYRLCSAFRAVIGRSCWIECTRLEVGSGYVVQRAFGSGMLAIPATNFVWIASCSSASWIVNTQVPCTARVPGTKHQTRCGSWRSKIEPLLPFILSSGMCIRTHGYVCALHKTIMCSIMLFPNLSERRCFCIDSKQHHLIESSRQRVEVSSQLHCQTVVRDQEFDTSIVLFSPPLSNPQAQKDITNDHGDDRDHMHYHISDSSTIGRSINSEHHSAHAWGQNTAQTLVWRQGGPGIPGSNIRPVARSNTLLLERSTITRPIELDPRTSHREMETRHDRFDSEI